MTTQARGPETLDEWMALVDGEVRAVCDQKSWGHQIRRKWSIREKPVADSGIDDYEWKLIPGAVGAQSLEQQDDYEGRYYVLGIDTHLGCFTFQHSTSHCGVWGRHFNMETFTRIGFQAILGGQPDPDRQDRLRYYLLELVDRFEPNTFSRT